MLRNEIMSTLVITMSVTAMTAPAAHGGDGTCQPEVIRSIGGYVNGFALAGPLAFVVSDQGTLLIVDVTDPEDPYIVGYLDTPGTARDIAVRDGLAYLADGPAGLHVVDISDPTRPAMVGSVQTPGAASGVTLMDALALVADGSAGLQIIDISVPARPLIVGSTTTRHDALDVAVSGTIASVAEAYTVEIIDVADPARPLVVGSAGTGRAVAAQGSFVYATDAVLQVIDVSDPANPLIVGSSPEQIFGFSVAVEDGLALVGSFFGLHIFDVSDPANPRELGNLDSKGIYTTGVAFGAGVAYITDAQCGLQIVDLGDPSRPILSASMGGLYSVSDILVSDQFAYATACGLHVLDLSDPANPTIVGSADLRDLQFPNTVSVDVVGDRAYVAGDRTGLWIVDVRDPRHPFIVTVVEMESSVMGVSVSGPLAAVAAGQGLRVLDVGDSRHIVELGWAPIGTLYDVALEDGIAYVTPGLRLVDLSDPAMPLELRSEWMPAIGIELERDTIFVAGWSSGLHLFDVSSPMTPVLVSTVDTAGSARAVAIKDHRAFIADNNGGLQVADISNPYEPALIGGVPVPGGARSVAVAGDAAYVGGGGSHGLHAIDISSCHPACLADTDRDASVGMLDLDNVLLDWGSDGSANGGDVNGDGVVDVDDLIAVIAGWGPCG